MLLEIVIGVSAVSGCITAITIASLSLVKSIHRDEIKEEREEGISFIDSYGELDNCPFCDIVNPLGQGRPKGLTCKAFMDKGDKPGMKDHNWSGSSGPSSGVTVHTSNGIRLYQACTRCVGEWYTLPASAKKAKAELNKPFIEEIKKARSVKRKSTLS
jgi:hypothetical protein